MADIATSILEVGSNRLILQDAEARTKINEAYVTDTASGVIASFPDGADGVPVKSLTVAVEPVQDLHGQANPYPAGGGKNLLPITITGETTVNGLKRTPVFDADGNLQYILLNGNCTAQSDIIISGTWGSSDTLFTLPAGTYTFSKGVNNSNFAFIMRVGATNIISTYSTPYNFTLNADTNVSFCFFRCSAGQYDNVKVYPQIEVGSSASAYAPYSNICPISGHTQAQVTRTGKNLFISPTTGTSAGITYTQNSNGTFTVNGTATGYSYRDATGTLKAGSYVLTGGGNNVNLHVRNADTDSAIAISNTAGSGASFTLASDTNVKFRLQVNSGASISNLVVSPMVRLSSNTDNTFEPYSGQTYTIDLDGTRYGGTLDVTTGVLTVDRAIYAFTGSESLTRNTQGSNYRFLFNGVSGAVATDEYGENTKCSHYTPNRSPLYGNAVNNAIGIASPYVGWRDDSMSSVDDMKAYLSAQNALGNPVTICYTLATPFTVQLSPTEVKTLLGSNNIWSDTGNTEVEYRADTKLYIDKRLS